MISNVQTGPGQANATYLSERDRAEPAPAVWFAAHLFFDEDGRRSRALGDRVLQQIVRPIVLEQPWTRYFFIRYSELGPHIRLRLEGDRDTVAVRGRALIESLCGLGDVRVDDAGTVYPSPHGALNAVRFLPYEPETARYAGPVGVDLSEDFFHASSRLTLELLPDIGDSGTRSSKAVLAMTLLLHALAKDRTHAVELAYEYSRLSLRWLQETHPDMAQGENGEFHRAFDASYERQAPALAATVTGLWNALDAGAELPPPFEAFRQALARLRQQLEAALTARQLVLRDKPLKTWREATRRLVPSYLHMGNNRLGIFIFEESYLGHLTGRLLASVGDPPPQP